MQISQVWVASAEVVYRYSEAVIYQRMKFVDGDLIMPE